MSSLIVIGGGEHARVVIDTAIIANFDIAGYSADAESPVLRDRFGVRWLGNTDTCIRWAAGKRIPFVLGVGAVDVSERRQTAVRPFEASGVEFVSVVHPRAWVSPSARLAPGVVVMAGAMINTGATIGAHCIVNTGAVVEHDCALDDFAILAPAVAVGGGASVGAGSYLGLGCRVRDHAQIGARTLVAMGAVVTSDVASDLMVMGVPARPRP